MKKLIVTFLVMVLLAGCGQTSGAPGNSADTEPADSNIPATAAPESSAEPMLLLDPGPSVFLNGVQLEGNLRHGDIVYVNANLFCLTLGGTVDQEGRASFTMGEKTYSFSPTFGHMMCDNKAMVLGAPVIKVHELAYIPLEEVCTFAELSLFIDEEYDGYYCTGAAWPRQVPEGYRVPVFMYHAVDEDAWGIEELFVLPDRLEEQLQYLTENGYDPIFFEDLYHVQDYDKPVILTFDDGYEDNYTNLFPLLKKYNVKATVFMITGYNNQNKYLADWQLREMANSGLVSIQSHTVTHPSLDQLSYEEQRKELEDSKLHIARLTLREPFVLCFPTGAYNEDTLAAMEGVYSFGIKINGGLYYTRSDPFQVNRYYVARDDTIHWFRDVLEDAFE